MTFIRSFRMLALCCLLLSGSTFGQGPAVLTLDSQALSGKRVGTYVEYILDARDASHFEDIKREWNQLSPKRKKKDAFGLGMFNQPHWFKLVVEQPAATSQIIFLEHDYPSQLFEIFHLNPQQELKTFRVGYSVPRPEVLDYRNQTIRLDLEPGTHEFYFRLEHTGAMRFSVRTWSPEAFSLAKVQEEAFLGILLGISILMVFYNTFIYLTSRASIYLYYVGYLCTTTLFLVFYSGVGQQWGSSIKWFLANFWIGCVSLMLFFVLRFTSVFLSLDQSYPRINQLIRWVGYGCLLNILLAQVLPDAAFILAQAITNPMLSLCLGIATLAAWKGYRPARFYLIAFMAVIAGALLEGMVAQNIIDPEYGFWPFFSTYCVQMVLLSLAIGDQIRLNEAIAKQKIEKLNEELRHNLDHISEIVEDKTKEIKSLLDHIPQGVFSIEEDLRLSKQHSAHLPLLLKTREIGGQGLKELILDRSRLSEDSKDRILQTLTSTLGEDSLNFEANYHNLPPELTYQDYEGKEKIFDLTWNNEVGNQGTTKRVLVTMLDVTESKAIAKEFEQQQIELRYIKELIDCGPARFSQFVSTASPILEENRRLTSMGQLDPDSIRILFINAHTIKGGARMLGLSDLSNAIHEAEHTYAQVMKGQIAVDRQRLESERLMIDDIMNRYIYVHEETLGRKNNLSKVELDRWVLNEHCELIQILDKNILRSMEAKFAEKLQNSIQVLTSLLYRRLPHVVEECFAQASRIAKDLGKPCPDIRIRVVDMLVPQNIEDVLRKMTVHLLRNALDHGIESSDERVKKGKNQKGVITIESWLDDSGLIIQIEDDGRGLAIAKLREKALESRRLNRDATLDQIASTIFDSGVSTAREISHVSGRGIGMDAIKRFVEEVGGSTEIVLGSPHDQEGHYYSFRFRFIFPRLRDLKVA